MLAPNELEVWGHCGFPDDPLWVFIRAPDDSMQFISFAGARSNPDAYPQIVSSWPRFDSPGYKDVSDAIQDGTWKRIGTYNIDTGVITFNAS